MVWLASKISGTSKNQNNFEMANVAKSSSKNLVANGNCEFRSVEIISDYGYKYRPPKGIKAMITQCGEKTVCIGTLNDMEDLKEGEILIFNDSGAGILLKNNGDIVLNGVTITRDGVITANEFVVKE